MSRTQKTVYLAVLLSMAVMLHIFESFLPNPLLFPGAKLGLANIITLVTIVLFGAKYGLSLAVLRSLTGSLLGGTFLTFGFILSFAGAVMSGLVMALLHKYGRQRFSLIGLSVAGAIFHNLAQLTAASLWADQIGLFLYLPYLIFFAVPTGYFNALAARLIIRLLTPRFGRGGSPDTRRLPRA